ncbi:MAG: metal ABC transporter solute-binding protein, Zn/Mn family [Thermoleophilia bacterium]
MRRPLLRLVAVPVAALVAIAIAAGCGDDDGSGDGRPVIVVTTPILGAVVGEMVGDAADVRTVIPNGADPHDFQPSAKDAAALEDADLIVENGLDLEEGLEDALRQARDAGVPFYTATDHVPLRESGGGEHHDEEEHAGEGQDDHEHGPEDPHIWMDPIAMRDVVITLGPAITEATGLDVTAGSAAATERLTALDAEAREILAAVPADRRKLVTGHESMGYFADRYDFELVGAVIPGLSSQAQVSASALAELREVIEHEGVPAVFAELGTPEGVAEAIASETGARLVPIGTHALPEDGSYETFILDAARAVRDGLAPDGG